MSPTQLRCVIFDAEAIVHVNQCFNDPRQAVGDWKQAHCLGDETAIQTARRGAKWQKPLPESVVGFIEVHVGILPNDPMCKDIKYVCEKVVQWRKPGNDPRHQLDSVLNFLSVHHTDEIRSLIHQVTQKEVADAVKIARHQERISIRQETHQQMDEFLSHFKVHLDSLGLEASAIEALRLDSFLSNCKAGSVTSAQEPTWSSSSNKRASSAVAVTGTQLANKMQRKPENRKGRKQLPPRINFRYWSATKKMDYLLEVVADDDTGSYDRHGRPFLNKINKAVKCYKNCCNSDMSVFLGLHGTTKNGITNFAPTDPSNLDGCSTCSNKSKSSSAGTVNE